MAPNDGQPLPGMGHAQEILRRTVRNVAASGRFWWTFLAECSLPGVSGWRFSGITKPD